LLLIRDRTERNASHRTAPHRWLRRRLRRFASSPATAKADAPNRDVDLLDVEALGQVRAPMGAKIRTRRNVVQPSADAAHRVVMGLQPRLVAIGLPDRRHARSQAGLNEGIQDLVDRLLAQVLVVEQQARMELRRGRVAPQATQEAQRRDALARGTETVPRELLGDPVVGGALGDGEPSGVAEQRSNGARGRCGNGAELAVNPGLAAVRSSPAKLPSGAYAQSAQSLLMRRRTRPRRRRARS
jgi:hypothetical protein